MKAFTIESDGRCVRGIALVAGMIRLGVCAIDGRPVDYDPGPCTAVVGGRLEHGFTGSGVQLLIIDQAGEFGSWHMRASHPDERWDAMVAIEAIKNTLDRVLASEKIRARYPHQATSGWVEFARGSWSPVAENARPRVNVYGHLPEGGSFEIRRRGRARGEPAVLRVACVGGDVVVSDPLAEARARRTMAAGGA